MPNLKINNKTYSGVSEVHIPLADGSGNEDFAYITSETKSITENGTHDVKHYGTVNVNVPTEGDGIIPSGTKTITENGNYDVILYANANVALPETEQATPSISVSSGGLITASATQDAGVVPAGTKSATKQLSTQSAKTVTPSTSNQTAVSSGKYTTGAVTVKGDSNLVSGNIKSGVSIFGVTGSYEGASSGGIDTSDANATAKEITSGYTAYVKGSKLTGTNPYAKDATDATVSEQGSLLDQALSAIAGKAAGGSGSGNSGAFSASEEFIWTASSKITSSTGKVTISHSLGVKPDGFHIMGVETEQGSGTEHIVNNIIYDRQYMVYAEVYPFIFTLAIGNNLGSPSAAMFLDTGENCTSSNIAFQFSDGNSTQTCIPANKQYRVLVYKR